MPLADFMKRTKRFSKPEPKVTNKAEAVKKEVGKLDDQRKENEPTDDSVDQATGRNPEHDSSPEIEAPKREAIKDDEVKGPAIKSQTQKQTKVLMNFFTRATTYQMTQVSYTQCSEYVPNAVPLLKLLMQANNLMSTSPTITKYYKNYCPYAAITGFVLCFYIHIIDCRADAGEASGYEKSALKKFTDSFPLQGIQLPDFVFHYLDTIVATKFDDIKYSLIVPSMDNGTNDYAYTFNYDATTTTAHYNDSQGLGLFLPNFPAMLMMLAAFGDEDQISLGTRMNDGAYTPFDLGADVANAFCMGATGLQLATGATATTGNDLRQIFNNCGMMVPFQFETDDQETARKYIRTSEFYGRRGVNFSAKGAFNNINDVTHRTNINFNRPDFFLNLGKDQSPAFVEYLIYNMNIMCKAFDSSYNMSDLRLRGGLETTIIAHLRTEAEVDTTNHRHVFENVRMGQLRNDQVVWGNLNDRKERNQLTANFQSTKAGITRVQELTAMTFGTVALPPVHGIDKRHFLRGKYYNDIVDQNIKFRLGDSTDIRGAKPMYQGWMNDVLVPSFNKRVN